MKNSVILIVCLLIACTSCKQKTSISGRKAPVWRQPSNYSYKLQNRKQWVEANAANPTANDIVLLSNRVDVQNLQKLDSILVPTDLTGDLVYYQPFPLDVPYLREVNKIIFFSYATQTFAAYENGYLVYAGPTSMGRRKDQTPTGLFFTNWKAEKTTSTFNDEWDLKWNFNIENKLGVGFHEYELPGYPASHSCLRLLAKDAKYLYKFADQWVLANKNEVKVKGTPVIVFGSYPFDGPKPWLQLLDNTKALNYSKGDIEDQTSSYLQKILDAQQTRSDYEASKAN